MAVAPARHAPENPHPPAVEAMHILWITAGLGCDGDSIAVTAATRPSLEDLVLGGIPGLPEVRLHHPALAYENGDEFLDAWYRAADRLLAPFLLVVEGSIPNEKNKEEGFWAAVGVDRATGQTITTCEWIDCLASTSCGRSAASPHVSLAEFTCTWGPARPSRPATNRCSVWRRRRRHTHDGTAVDTRERPSDDRRQGWM